MKTLITLAGTLLSVFLCSNALCVQKSILVEWEYTAPESPTVTGFQLYMGGTPLNGCLFSGANTRYGECVVDLSNRHQTFTLTAIFDDTAQSPESDGYKLYKRAGNKRENGRQSSWIGVQ